ncbi:hypothetical protein FPV67DRAFT_1786045 [Lyophyllum atratum]|nr:hypothetical protein FPV67DRAFT_1786045 [Lyophyllum atratum]
MSGTTAASGNCVSQPRTAADFSNANYHQHHHPHHRAYSAVNNSRDLCATLLEDTKRYLIQVTIRCFLYCSYTCGFEVISSKPSHIPKGKTFSTLYLTYLSLMAQRHLPPVYMTSDATAASVSLAYSSKFNSRGLERLWYSPYTHTFTDLVKPYNGHILVHPQYPIFVPSAITMKLQLMRDFEAAGRNYPGGSKKNPNLPVAGPTATSSASDQRPRTSARLVQKEQDNAVAMQEQEAKKLEDLMKRKVVVEKQEKAYIAANDADTSIASVASETQDEAVDKLPDIVLGHVGKFKMSAGKDTAHYIHRAGVKIFHHCCVLIGELKPQPPRGLKKGTETTMHIHQALKTAQIDLVEYVAAYFAREPNADSVIAFAAAGPYWRWAHITQASGHVPSMAWAQTTMFKENAKETKDFHRQFRTPFFTLGTKKSDDELTKISRQYFQPLLDDVDHTGNQPEEEEEEEDEEEEEEEVAGEQEGGDDGDKEEEQEAEEED